MWLCQWRERINDIEDGILSPLNQFTGDLPMGRRGQVYFSRHLRVGQEKLLHDSPSMIEHLHERAIIRKRTDDQIPSLVFANPVVPSLCGGNDSNPQAICRLKLFGVDLDGCSDPSITIRRSQEQIRLPETVDARR